LLTGVGGCQKTVRRVENEAMQRIINEEAETFSCCLY
jgi:hypothetical protein